MHPLMQANIRAYMTYLFEFKLGSVANFSSPGSVHNPRASLPNSLVRYRQSAHRLNPPVAMRQRGWPRFHPDAVNLLFTQLHH